jgi:hypothetical protein
MRSSQLAIVLPNSVTKNHQIHIRRKEFTMNKKISLRNIALFAVIASLALVAAFNAPDAKADDTFAVSVYHGINGRALGLSKALPVDVDIYLDGALLTTLQLEFGDRIITDLPAGEYLIEVTSQEAGPLPSMTVGPVEIPAGVDVSIMAKLSGAKTPILKVKVK